jgi:hypothetical protein
MVNPMFRMGPGMTAQQMAANTALAGMTAQQAAVNTALAGQANPLLSSVMNPYAASMMSNPAGYGAGGSSYSPYYESSYGGFLRGNADVINASGQYLINFERANLAKEQVRQARLDTRRRAFDEYLYERANTPTLEDERERSMELERRRSVNDPPVTEIWSAKALNDLLHDVQKLQANGTDGPQLRIDEDVLKRINVSAGGTPGNVGLLKNEGKLSWPLALRTMRPQQEIDDLRQDIGSLLPDAINQAINGKVAAGILRTLNKDVSRMQQLLAQNVGELPPDQYIEAKRFLNNLEDGLTALAQPDAGLYFTQKYSAKGKTVQDLIDYMTKQGLTFAPAVPGDEAAYVALHRALASYDRAARGRTSAEK